MNARVVVLLVGAAFGCKRSKPPAEACLQLDAPTAPVGFDAPFSIVARMACPERGAGRITWRQLDGVPLRALAPANDGFLLAGRTPALADASPGPAPWGVIPLSPRTRGEVTLEALWSDGRGGSLRRQVRIAAASRSRGLPNTPVGARVYLGGEGWHLLSRPPGSGAALDAHEGAPSLLPDVAGDYQLGDGHGRELALRAARYDDTPLDCGRAGCHAAIAEAAARSPMTTVMARGLVRAHGGATPAFGPDYPGCALPCHATGEPGLSDGGFAQVAAELGLAPETPSPWELLPRALRRLGGVGCLACHGPAALPQPSARWSVLRADVCAVCHDAPPRYGQVVAWRGTAMARADRDARARSERACVRCHTTWGFLATRGDGADRRPPDGTGPIGISCAACHAAHAHETGGPPGALLRAPPAPALLTEVARTDASQICLGCHTPEPNDVTPSASAAAVWLGRGGLDPASGQALTGVAVHGGVSGGCIGCHRAGPATLARGAGHAFAAPAATCTPCHPQLPPASPDLAARARRLWSAWRKDAPPAAPGSRPIHAGDVRLDRGTPLGRAAWNVLLVLEDPAAAAHNARYARALLDAAEPVIDAAQERR